MYKTLFDSFNMIYQAPDQLDLEKVCFHKSIDTKLLEGYCKKVCNFVGINATDTVTSKFRTELCTQVFSLYSFESFS